MVREAGMFYNTKTGKYIPDSEAVRRAYRKNPDYFLLPIGLEFTGTGFLKSSRQYATITLKFSKYRQVKTSKFVLPHETQIDRIGTKTFQYTSRADLRKKKGDFLKGLNRGVQMGDEDYEEVFYFDESVKELFADTPAYGKLPSVKLPPLVMGKLKVLYDYSILDQEYIRSYPDRCVWNYLQYKLKIKYNILQKYNEETNDKWSLVSLMNLAKGEHYRLQIYDIQGEIWVENGEEVIHIPENRKHRSAICFMVVDKHIYPFTQQFQKQLLCANEREVDANPQFQVQETGKSLNGIMNIKNQEQREALLQEHKDEELEMSRSVAIDEWEWDARLLLKYKHIFIKTRRATDTEGNTMTLPAENLNQLAERIFQETQTIYNCELLDGDIRTIYKTEKVGEGIELVWKIYADPNYDVVKPMCDKLGINYKNTCISSVGSIIYGETHNINHLKSDMLDGILNTPFSAFKNNQLIGIPNHNINFNEDELEYASIDINKCYSSVLENPHSQWCIYRPLDTIEPYKETIKKTINSGNFSKKVVLKPGYYYIHTDYSKDTNGLFIPFEKPHPNGWYCPRVLELASAKQIPYVVKKQYIPKNVLPKDHFQEFVSKLYSILGSEAKKPVNAFIGKLGRRDKVKVKCKGSVLTNEYDAQYFQNKEQIIKPITKSLMTSYNYELKEANTLASPIYNQIIQEAWCKLQELYDQINFTKMKEVETEAPLTRLEWKFGYGGGKKHIFGEMEYEEYLRKIVRKRSIQIGGAIYFNTDSVVLVSEDITHSIKNVPFGVGRGEFRIEWDKGDTTYLDKIEEIKRRKVNENEHFAKVSKLHTKRVKNYTNFKELIDAEQGFQLLGMAGTGKSYTTKDIIQYLEQQQLNYAICAFTHAASHNKLFVENGIEGQTLHSFLGIRPGDGKANYDGCKDLNYILVDECSMIPEFILNKLRHIKEVYKTKIILIGDYEQLAPVNCYYTNQEIAKSALIKFITDYNKITLTENKRSGEEGEYMFRLYKNILKGGSLYKKHKLKGHWIEEHMSLIHICWTNKKRQELNKEVIRIIRAINKPVEFNLPEVDEHTEPLIGFKDLFVRAKKNGDFYYNNQTFNMKSYEEGSVELCDVITKTHFKIELKNYYKDFEYGYAGTAHKYQGATIPPNQPFIIHEADIMRKCSTEWKNWLYVAVSRASNSKQFKIV